MRHAFRSHDERPSICAIERSQQTFSLLLHQLLRSCESLPLFRDRALESRNLVVEA